MGTYSFSQGKYVLDLLKKIRKIGCNPSSTLIDSKKKLNSEEGEPLDNENQYQRLVGKLIYLTVIRPDISFAVSQISQFMHAPKTIHMEAVNKILRYLKKTPGKVILMKNNNTKEICDYFDADWDRSFDRKSTTSYCTFVGGNIVILKSKKQNAVARSSAEAEYRAMASTVSELIWIKQLLADLNITTHLPIKMFCDNQAACHIASNPVFQERTKHIEIDCHFI
jgi:hypothetical protein